MQYRPNRNGAPISLLGFGCMRFTRKGNSIDYAKAESEILAAIDAGVNYFDTAYIYSGSEVLLGEVLARNNCRDAVNIATKLPQYLLRTAGELDRYFAEQLARLQTDRIDYYLMHMLTDLASWQKLERLGIRQWVADKKASGAIANFGFSFHGNTETFLQLLDAYDWDFCQIQYNYMDETSQAGRRGLQAAAQRGLPVIVMEPLRGGKLVELLPQAAKNRIAADARQWSAAEWGLRWLWNQPEVSCVLSGMNSTAMVAENCRIASEVQPGGFGAGEQAFIQALKEDLTKDVKVNCTGCRYCMPCPKGIDIPQAFLCYNRMYTEKKSTGRREYWQTATLRRDPAFAAACIGCGACESHCPQHLPIRSLLKQADAALRPLPHRAAAAAVRFYLFGRKGKQQK